MPPYCAETMPCCRYCASVHAATAWNQPAYTYEYFTGRGPFWKHFEGVEIALGKCQAGNQPLALCTAIARQPQPKSLTARGLPLQIELPRDRSSQDVFLVAQIDDSFWRSVVESVVTHNLETTQTPPFFSQQVRQWIS